MKIAAFLPNWIGDAVMATPALAAIRSEFPGAEIVAVLRPYVAAVLDGTGLADRVIGWDPRGEDPRESGWRLALRLRRERFDVAVLFPNSLRCAWMARLAGVRRRIGFARDWRGWLLTDPLPAASRHTPRPALDDYLRLAETLGCRRLERTMHLATTEDDERCWGELQTMWQPQLAGRPYICLNPGGAFGASKHWPSASFGALARRIVDELDHAVVVVCGPAERDAAAEIVKGADDPRVVSLAQQQATGVGLTKAVIRHAAALVTTDSGPRHFAPPFGVPVLTLFGPTHVGWSENGAERAVDLQLEVDCGPCQQRTCPHGHHRCMQELTPEMVYAGLQQLLLRGSAA